VHLLSIGAIFALARIAAPEGLHLDILRQHLHFSLMCRKHVYPDEHPWFSKVQQHRELQPATIPKNEPAR
jgi:hypothetical protein